jgi:formiminoglutamate deiminase
VERWLAPWAWSGGEQLVADVAIDVAAGRIAAVHAGPERGPDPNRVHRLDGIVTPGFVTAHSHAFHRALRGHTHAGAGDFWTWRDQMYRIAGTLDPDTYHRLAADVFAEMLRAGFTCVGEFHYVHHRPDGTPFADLGAMEHAIAEAAEVAGIRLTLLDTCYLRANPAGAPPGPDQRRFSDGTVEEWARRAQRVASAVASERVRPGVAAHSVRAVMPDDLRTIAAVATDLDAPLHVHVSEQRAENDQCLEAHGVTPVGLLERAGVLRSGTTAVHATHLSDEDQTTVADSGAGACFCPTTERDLGDGIGPAFELGERGVAISLGTDSNAVVDPFEEMRAIEMNDRLRLERRGVHPPAQLLAMATMNGLAALGWGEHQPLAPGSPADFVCIDASDLAGFDPTDGVGGLVHAATRYNVSDVVVGGRRIVASRTNTTGHSPASLHGVIREILDEKDEA